VHCEVAYRGRGDRGAPRQPGTSSGV